MKILRRPTKQELIDDMDELRERDGDDRANLTLAKLIAGVESDVDMMQSRHYGVRDSRHTDKQVVTLLADAIERMLTKDEEGKEIWTVRDMRDLGFPRKAVNALDALIPRLGELPFDHVERLSTDKLAIDRMLVRLSYQMDYARGDNKFWDCETEEGQYKIECRNIMVLSQVYLVAVKNNLVPPACPMRDFVGGRDDLNGVNVVKGLLDDYSSRSEDISLGKAFRKISFRPNPPSVKMEFLPKETLIARADEIRAEFRAKHKTELEADVHLAALASASAHFGEKLRSGDNYLTHSMQVATRNTRAQKKYAIGLLHDVVENSNWTIDDLRQLYMVGKKANGDWEKHDIVDAVDAMTHRPGETYCAYIKRLSLNALAVDCKLEDVGHNRDASREIDFWEIDSDHGKKRMTKNNGYILITRYLTDVQSGKVKPGTDVRDYVLKQLDLASSKIVEDLLSDPEFCEPPNQGQQLRMSLRKVMFRQPPEKVRPSKPRSKSGQFPSVMPPSRSNGTK